MREIYHKNLIPGLIIKFLIYGAYYQMGPVIVTHLTGLGFDSAACGIVTGSVFVAMLAARPFAGFLSARFNLKWLLIFTALASLIATALLSCATSFPLILASEILYGVGLCMLTNANDTLLLYGIPEGKMGIAISGIGLIPAVCSAFCPWVALRITDVLGSAAVFRVCAVISSLILVPALLISADDAPKAEHDSISVSSFISFSVLPFALLGASFAAAIGLVTSFLVSTASQNGITDCGIFFTVTAAVMVFLKLLSGSLIDRKGLRIVAIPAYLLTIAGLLMIPRAHSTGSLIACAVLFAFAQGSGQPAMQIQCCRMVSSQERGLAIGTFFFGLSLGQAAGNIFGGMIINVCGYSAVYYFSAALLGVSLFAYLLSDQLATKKNYQ